MARMGTELPAPGLQPPLCHFPRDLRPFGVPLLLLALGAAAGGVPSPCPSVPFSALPVPLSRGRSSFTPDQPPNGQLLITGGACSPEELMSLFVWRFAANCITLFFPPVRLFYFYTFDSEHDNNNNRLTLANRLTWCIIHVKDKQLSLASHIIIRFLLMSSSVMRLVQIKSLIPGG